MTSSSEPEFFNHPSNSTEARAKLEHQHTSVPSLPLLPLTPQDDIKHSAELPPVASLSSPSSASTRSQSAPFDSPMTTARRSEKNAAIIDKLNEKWTYDKFRDHLQSYHAAENLTFWRSVEEFRNIPSDHIAVEAKRIFNSWLSHDSDCQINLPGRVVRSPRRLKDSTAHSSIHFLRHPLH